MSPLRKRKIPFKLFQQQKASAFQSFMLHISWHKDPSFFWDALVFWCLYQEMLRWIVSYREIQDHSQWESMHWAQLLCEQHGSASPPYHPEPCTGLAYFCPWRSWGSWTAGFVEALACHPRVHRSPSCPSALWENKQSSWHSNTLGFNAFWPMHWVNYSDNPEQSTYLVKQ